MRAHEYVHLQVSLMCLQLDRALLNFASGDTASAFGDTGASAKYLEVPDGVTLPREEVVAMRDGVLGSFTLRFLASFEEFDGLAVSVGAVDFLFGEK